jgi:hypothetical protein
MMNQLIRDLERQSGIELYGLGLDRAKWEATLETFVKLVVLECIRACPQEDGRQHIRKHFELNKSSI